jgi:glutathione S-transferase
MAVRGEGDATMSDEIDFYMAPQTRAVTVHWMLEEVGAPYRMHVLDLEAGEHKQPDFLALNPMGKVPAIVHQGTVVTEVAAICLYLADAFPAADLAPPIGDPRRGTYLRWLMFVPGCVEPAMVDRGLERPPGPPRSLGYGDFDTTMQVMAGALTPGPYLLGEHFTAADVMMGSAVRWGMLTKLLPERPEFLAYAGRLSERPALQRSMQQQATLTAQRR